MEDKSWLGNLFCKITKGLNDFILLFKKHGIIYTLIMMALFIAFWSLIINPIKVNDIIEKRLEHQYNKELQYVKEEKITEEEKRVEADNIINPMMEEIIDRFDVDRVLLFELHNGTKNISGTSFIFFSSTYEVIDLDNTELDLIGDNFQRQYANQMLGRQIFSTLQHRQYITFEDISNIPKHRSTLLFKLNKFGINNIMIIPIKDKENKIVMMVCIASKNNTEYQKIYDYAKPFIQQIEISML